MEILVLILNLIQIWRTRKSFLNPPLTKNSRKERIHQEFFNPYWPYHRHKKPDIVIVDKESNEATTIDVAIPNDNNLARKRLDKLRAYTDLSVEIKSLWNLTKVPVPVIVCAMGTFYSHFKTDVKKIPFENLNLEQYEMQKNALPGTAHVMRSFLQIA